MSANNRRLAGTLTLFASGCAVGPVGLHETARTVGNANAEFVGGLSSAGHVIKINYGLSGQLDLGLQAETYGGGARAKWAPYQSDHGLSVAFAGGAAFSIGGTSIYGDAIASYAGLRWGEPFLALRVTQLSQSLLNLGPQEYGFVGFDAIEPQLRYTQYILGHRYWATGRIYFSWEVSRLMAVRNVTITNPWVFSAGVGLRNVGAPPTLRSR